jgi:hypothetical protein
MKDRQELIQRNARSKIPSEKAEWLLRPIKRWQTAGQVLSGPSLARSTPAAASMWLI